MNLLTEEMKLEAVVVTEAVAEEEESRRAFAKTVHMTALQAHTKPMQPTRSSTGSCRTKGENPLIFTDSLSHGHFGAKTNGMGLKLCYRWYHIEMNTLSHRRQQKQENSSGWSVSEASCCESSLRL